MTRHFATWAQRRAARPLARAVMLALVMASCYSPKLSECTVRCALSADCPDGAFCATDRFCHSANEEALCQCKPLTCKDVPGTCGTLDDTCGSTIQCGACQAPQTCGGGGTPNVCGGGGGGGGGGCTPRTCEPDACGPSTDSCGNPRNCPSCPQGKKCSNGKCVACTPRCAEGELACGDDGCGQSCGSCPDDRWTCHQAGICCIRSGQRCMPLTEGCNCCPGLFCQSGFCVPASGCAMATERALEPEPVFE